MKKILIVEDEEDIRRFIGLNLKMSGYQYKEAPDGETAVDLVDSEKFDLVLLDLQLPGKDGKELYAYFKEKDPGMGIIMVTARGLDTDKIMGLELGADDYVTKPFNPIELIARIRSVLRRLEKHESSPAVNGFSDNIIEIDFSSRVIKQNDIEVTLTPKEFDLLVILIKNSPAMFTRDEILNLVWGDDAYIVLKTVDVHIQRLRKKLEADPQNPKYIKTVWGSGYRWGGGN